MCFRSMMLLCNKPVGCLIAADKGMRAGLPEPTARKERVRTGRCRHEAHHAKRAGNSPKI